ncbi:hypothetical protein D3C87_1318590 [compost metagenome]
MLERDIGCQVVSGLDFFYVLVLGGDFTGQQMELVESALDLARVVWHRVGQLFSRFIGDPQCFYACVFVAADVLVQVVETIIVPGQGKAETQEIFLRWIGVTHIDLRLAGIRSGEVSSDPGQCGTTAAHRELMPIILIENFFQTARRRLHLFDAQMIANKFVVKMPGSQVVGGKADSADIAVSGRQGHHETRQGATVRAAEWLQQHLDEHTFTFDRQQDLLGVILDPGQHRGTVEHLVAKRHLVPFR